MLKVILVILILLMILSLAKAMTALFSSTSSHKTFHWLVVRIGLAAAIALCIAVGLLTGQFDMSAPWSSQY